MDAAFTGAKPRLTTDTRSIGNEGELIAQAQRGDVAAFERLYRRHVGKIHALCLRLTANEHTAEDVTQDAFVQAWRNLPRFRRASAFGSWLHRIAVNAALTRGRSDARQPLLDRDDNPPLARADSPDAGPVAMLDLERAIAMLPDGAREVFVLHDIEGYRHAEIAEFMGTAVGTCKAQLHRARQLLRARLSL
jgi:RNA polymerase sigma-70 factor (ECF subfamily)